jgi:hypothetical protein
VMMVEVGFEIEQRRMVPTNRSKNGWDRGT